MADDKLKTDKCGSYAHSGSLVLREGIPLYKLGVMLKKLLRFSQHHTELVKGYPCTSSV